jgi:hypothetical protein
MRVTVPLTSRKFLYCIVARLGPRNTPSVRPLAATDLHATPGAFPFYRLIGRTRDAGCLSQ